MTHRAFIHEYIGAVYAFNLTASDRVLNALPLYHSAQMHAFFLPSLMVGAYNVILPVPDPATVLEKIESEQITSFFAAPTVWVAIANHADLAARDLSSLKTAIYGASIMPGPVLARLQERLPELGFYNGFGQSELGPLCTVLLPDEHPDHPGSAGGRHYSLRRVSSIRTAMMSRPGSEVKFSIDRPNCVTAIGTSPTRLPKPFAAAGFIPAIWSSKTRMASSRLWTG